MAISRDRALRWLELAALLGLVALLGLHTLPRAWTKLNTDFPNYYISARLVHEGFDTSRLYEWVWLQRQKDHLGIDVNVIGMLPITPISTLVVWPLTWLKPLEAKHVWLLLNLGLLVPLCGLLSKMTGLSWRRVVLVFAISFPLHRNLLYGQFYLVLLLLIVLACMAYLRGWRVVAGVLIAVATSCKIFPLVFFVWFVQRRAWRAVAAGALAGAAIFSLSIWIFGWNLHWTYLREVLPWTLHGEGLPPYDMGSESLSSILHFLFLDEPQWNPYPWHKSVWIYALLQPMISMMVAAPAVLLIQRKDLNIRTVQLEWSALLVACLATSTIPASYNFVLLAFPVCVMAAALLERERYGWVTVLLIVYLGIGLPLPAPSGITGPSIVLHVPRLPLLLLIVAGNYALLWRKRDQRQLWDWTKWGWATVMAVAVVANVYSTLKRERAVRNEYAYRLPLRTQALLAASPVLSDDGIHYVAFMPTGYHLGGELKSADGAGDDLSFAVRKHDVWIEKALSPESEILGPMGASQIVVQDGRDPMPSSDERSLAYIKDRLGRGRLLERRDLVSAPGIDVALTPVSLNVYEATYLSEKEYAFAAVAGSGGPQIYLTDASHRNSLLPLGEARYPALSLDGHWLAYSRLENGVWNLWLRDERSGESHQVGNVPCNEIHPAWENDGKTLLYSTDCGRSLWFTAIAQRRVLP